MRGTKGRPRVKVWIESEEGSIFGPGIYTILATVMDQGSISEACRELGISYRKAWSRIKLSEDRLGISLLEKNRGGTSGGGSEITPEGNEILDRYESYLNEVQSHSQKIFNKYFD
jgi:molybdate transport system regulatory protein